MPASWEIFDMPENPEYAKLNVGKAAAVGPAYDNGAGKVNDCGPGLDAYLSTETTPLPVASLVSAEKE
jgi:hypothetical protein